MSNLGVWEPAEPGVKRCILNAAASLMMMEVHFEEGAEGYEHSHVHEQMSYCLRGSFVFRIDGKEYALSAGQSIAIPSNAKHGVTALEANSALLDVFTPIREDLLKR
ncbi:MULTISPECIES: cupin domain-containing protein [Paenibacillus]|jgi:quercetin dioxygenase-like cupin family protein|uniref:cupin domain-containing protein n=1 Tax=Paenibacillus TaxID=44249 RepID=UPI0004F90D96|nr:MULTISPECIES: cupin domain-containing protein [unclassified Paenibacillus]AIQ32916.1 cupin [Paenibacillus sp. FSL P4-0081]OMF28737.1 cupin [Paenibacillus sp. FSL H8-0259]